jgi:flagellar biosynthesis component FlhA
MQMYRNQFNTNDLLGKMHVPLGWPRKLFVGSIGLLLFCFVFYAGLEFGYKTYLDRSLVGIEAELESLGSQVEATTQDNFVRFRSQIDNLKMLLNDHVIISNFFPFIESITHERTTYSSSDLSLEEGKLKLTGITESYETLAAQLEVYEVSPWIEEVALEHSAASGGMVKFNVTLTIKDSIFEMAARSMFAESDTTEEDEVTTTVDETEEEITE